MSREARYLLWLLLLQHIIEGLLNFRRRVSRSFWLDFFFCAQQNTWSWPLRERLTSRGRVPKVPARMFVQSDPAAQGRQASSAVPKERHTSEAQVHCRPLRGA